MHIHRLKLATQYLYTKNNSANYIIAKTTVSHCTFSVAGQECTIEGQVYLELAPPPECQPTCSNPMPSCPHLPFAPGCVCPEGTVIDQIKNRCVPITECSKIDYNILLV